MNLEAAANTAREFFGLDPKDFEEDRRLQSQQMQANLLRAGQSPKEEYKQFQENYPVANLAAGFMPVVGQAQALADKAVADSFTEELLANLAMIPGVRPTRKIIAALDDLGEGGIKQLIYDLEKAGIVDEKMIRQMFDGDGNLRMFHGSNKMDLEDLTWEGTKKAADKSKDSWAGYGTYFSTNLDSPTNIPTGDELRIFERTVPRDQLDRYVVTNFFDNDFKRALGNTGQVPKYDTSAQTKRVQESLARMYPNENPADHMDLYDVSMMATDSPHNAGNWSHEWLKRANSPKPAGTYNIFEDKYALPGYAEPSEANARALAQGLRGNFHSDSNGVAAAVFNPEFMGGGRTFDITRPEIEAVQKVRKSKIPPLDNVHDPAWRSSLYEPEGFIADMGLEQVSDGWYKSPKLAESTDGRIFSEALDEEAKELGKLPPWEREATIQKMLDSGDELLAKKADWLENEYYWGSGKNSSATYDNFLDDFYKEMSDADTVEDQLKVIDLMRERGYDDEALSLAKFFNFSIPE